MAMMNLCPTEMHGERIDPIGAIGVLLVHGVGEIRCAEQILQEHAEFVTERDFVQQRLFFYNDVEQFEITILDITADDIMKAEGLIL